MIGDILGKWYDLEKKIDSVRWMKGMVNNSLQRMEGLRGEVLTE